MFRSRIEAAFASYTQSLNLLSLMRETRAFATDYVIVACSRLDSLALLARGGDGRRAFAEFLLRYSDARAQLRLISVPTLAADLVGQFFVVPALLEVPGRITSYDRRDTRFLEMIWQTGLPVTIDDVGRFVAFVLDSLERAYRVRPRQPHRKPTLASTDDVMATLAARARRHRRGEYAPAIAALLPLVSDYTLVNVLYRDFRSRAIHERHFGVNDRRFFREEGLYWEGLGPHPADAAVSGLRVEFSAQFLAELLRSSLDAYIAELVARRKVPLNLFLECFDLMTESELIDSERLVEPRTIRPSLGAR